MSARPQTPEGAVEALRLLERARNLGPRDFSDPVDCLAEVQDLIEEARAALSAPPAEPVNEWGYEGEGPEFGPCTTCGETLTLVGENPASLRCTNPGCET